MNTIGLFGTCGNSQWRNNFIKEYEKLNIDFFNPLVKEWKEENAIIESKHLKNDKIILLPITKETYGLGSLTEVGFGILRKNIIIMIENELDIHLHNEKDRAKESLRARKLAIEHLKQIDFENVFIVNNLEEMLNLSIKLYNELKKV